MNPNDFSKGAHETPSQAIHPRFRRHIQMPCDIGVLETADGQACGVGSCGDSVQVYLRIRDDTITDIRCDYHGCQYTLACASAVSKLVRGCTLARALQLEPSDVVVELGYLPDDYLHCARLAVNTLGEAIGDYFQNQR